MHVAIVLCSHLFASVKGLNGAVLGSLGGFELCGWNFANTEEGVFM